MNKSHKSIWNESLGTYVAAAETAGGAGRKTSSGRKARRVPPRAHAGQLALEQRIVFDAALPASLVEVQSESSAGSDPVWAELDQLQAEASQAEPADHVADDEATELHAAATEVPVEDERPGDAETVEADQVERVEIIFVDALVEGVAEHLAWHPGEVYVLDADRDGVEQMAEILNGRNGIDAIHIISHGSAGRLELGNATLDTDSLSREYADELSVIRAALSDEADLLLYGCDVSSTAEGQAFVGALAEATGAEVAASGDATGAASMGGDWVLEFNVGGAIETTVISATEYAGVLAAAVDTGAGAVLAVVGKQIYSIDVATGKGTLLTTVPATVGGVNTGDRGQNCLAANQDNGLIYYCAEFVVNFTANTALFAYDYVNDQHILVDANLGDHGVVVGNQGMGGGGAMFANGALYYGVESNFGGDGVGLDSEDAIYRITFAADGRSVVSATNFIPNIDSNDWGDLGYDPDTNEVLSLNGTTVNRFDADTGVFIGTATLPFGGQMGRDQLGNTYVVGAAMQSFDASTDTWGTSVTLTTDGTTPLGPVFDAAGWTPPTAALGDRVFSDTNANGIFDGTDSGIAGVTVQLVDDVNNNGAIDAGDRILATDTTNASGEYLFTGVLPGNYIVQVTDTGGVLGVGHTYTTAGGNTNANVDVAAIGSTNLTIDFGLINRAPVNVVPGPQVSAEDGTLVFPGLSVSDPDSNLSTTQLTVTNGVLNVSLAGGASISAGANGTSTLTLSGTAAQINAALASVGYQPTANYFGPAVLTVQSSDVGGLQDTDTVDITVTSVNDVPGIVPGNEIPNQNNNDNEAITPLDVSGTFADVDTTDVLSYSATGLPTGITLDANTGIISGTLDNSASQGGPGSDGIYSVTVTADDGNGGTVSDTFTWTVLNPAPTATENAYTVAEDAAVAVIGNALSDDTGAGVDSDPDADTLVVTPQTGVPGNNGGLFSIDAAGVITFDPAGDFEALAVGQSTTTALSYEISDGEGGTATATITVTINGVNDVPLATDDGPIATNADTPVAGNVLPNDSDIDGDLLTVTGFTVAGDPATYLAGETASIAGVGSLAIQGDGRFTFIPAPGYGGPVPSATYTITDGNATDTAVLSFSDVPVVPPAPAPDHPDWEDPVSPGRPMAPPAGSELHVLRAVSEASNERGMFAMALGAVQLNSPLLGEVMSQLPDSLMFESSTWVDQVGLLQEPGRGEVQVITPALYVQHAVRHEPIVTESGLFVQHAVRSAQLESRVRNAMIDAHQSATPGFASLLDPFALGAPKPELATAQAVEEQQPQARAQQAVASSEREAATQAVASVKDGPAQKALELPRTAPGFRAQVERFAKDRLHGSRPITRPTTVKS